MGRGRRGPFGRRQAKEQAKDVGSVQARSSGTCGGGSDSASVKAILMLQAKK